jgi:hypothetical protein
LRVAKDRQLSQTAGMNFRPAVLLGTFALGALALALAAAEQAKPEVKADEGKGIPADLLGDSRLAQIDEIEFAAPSIRQVFDTLQFLMPLPMADLERKLPERMPLDRADLAIELGFLLADGLLAVQAGQMEKVEELASDLARYSKALGTGDRVRRRAAGLLDSVRNKDVPRLKKELAAMQGDAEIDLLALKDADLAHLITLGGWIRALEVSVAAVDQQFSPERARKLMREDIADYYTETLAGLEPRISGRAKYLEMRDILAGLRHEMVVERDQEPTKEEISDIRKQAAKLVNLALQRQE